MNRRAFLQHTAKIMAGAAATPLLSRLISSPAFAQSARGYRAVVCLFMYGGNDGNNTLVPADAHYAEYAAARGSGLALARPSLNLLKAASSGRVFGLHPSLGQVSTLYNSGEAAWLANAGPLTVPLTKQQLQAGGSTPGGLYSHEDQQNEWQSAVTQTASNSGWGGRIADVLATQNSNAPTVISTGGWSLFGTGVKTTAAATGSGGNTLSVLNSLQSLLPVMTAADSNQKISHLQDQIAILKQEYLNTTQQISGAVQAGSTLKTVFPNTDLGQQLQAIAQVINGRSTLEANRQIFMCVDNGYDTHTQQIVIQSSNLAGVDAAIGAFANAMREINMFDQVTLFTMTDFARAMAGNGSGGSDHAWGNHHLVVGGSVRGGDIYGTFPSLVLGGDDDAYTIGQWIPTTSGSQYAATLARWLGVSAADCLGIFPELQNFKTPALGFL